MTAKNDRVINAAAARWNLPAFQNDILAGTPLVIGHNVVPTPVNVDFSKTSIFRGIQTGPILNLGARGRTY